MKRILLLTPLFIFSQLTVSQTPKVKLGIEVLQETNFNILKGKRVGLITNPTGVDSKLHSTVDILFSAPEVKLVALFGPEHGVRGNYSAGDKVETTTDSATNLPMYSLYGKTRKPTQEMLKGIDVLVYDIQDIGVRSYTYISTMGQAMQAAAENKIPFVVLDRPNPLGGTRIEGNIVEKGYESFVSAYPIPYVYALTCGELAKMLNDEAPADNKCDLTVIPMKGWKRIMLFEDTGLPWVPTSPHIPEATSPQYYVSTGIMGELGVISEGVGYTSPFHMCAAEWINAKEFADSLNALNLDGVLFRPLTFKPFYGKFKDQALNGVEIHITDPRSVHLIDIQFHCLQVHNQLYPDKNPFISESNRFSMFDKVNGTDQIRQLLLRNAPYSDISKYLQKDVEAFRTKSRRYFLY